MAWSRIFRISMVNWCLGRGCHRSLRLAAGTLPHRFFLEVFPLASWQSTAGALRAVSETNTTISPSSSPAGGQLSQPSGERIVLMDALDPLYRIHYGYKNDKLQNKAGEDTTLLHGFLVQFFTLMEMKPHPTHCIVVFDSPGKTFRDELFPGYKQNRPKMPAEIGQAIPKVKELLSKMGVKWVSIAGAEADDVIGTLAMRASKAAMDVYIISKDKDFLQLLTPCISILRGPIKGGNHILYTESMFKEEHEIEPSQWVDVLGLMGDFADNIPGVKGIGPKTAHLLIKEFGDVERVLGNADKVKRKSIREVLLSEQGQNSARLSKELVTINKQLDWPPLRFPLEESRLTLPKDDGASALNAFQMYELKTQGGRLQACFERWPHSLQENYGDGGEY